MPSDVAPAELPQHVDELFEQVPMKRALGLLDGNEVDRGGLILEHQETGEEHRPIGHLRRRVPKMAVPAILEPELAHPWRIGGCFVEVSEQRNQRAQLPPSL